VTSENGYNIFCKADFQILLSMRPTGGYISRILFTETIDNFSLCQTLHSIGYAPDIEKARSLICAELQVCRKGGWTYGDPAMKAILYEKGGVRLMAGGAPVSAK
jgi:hypothetical protein